MGKNFGLSVLGYAIVLVIILGVVMIISAPMMADKYKNENKENNNDRFETSSSRNELYNDRGNPFETESRLMDISNEIREVERRLNMRIDEISQTQGDYDSDLQEEEISDKYICTIEGVKDEYGNTVLITPETDISSQKIVFVCEYKR